MDTEPVPKLFFYNHFPRTRSLVLGGLSVLLALTSVAGCSEQEPSPKPIPAASSTIPEAIPIVSPVESPITTPSASATPEQSLQPLGFEGQFEELLEQRLDRARAPKGWPTEMLVVGVSDKAGEGDLFAEAPVQSIGYSEHDVNGDGVLNDVDPPAHKVGWFKVSPSDAIGQPGVNNLLFSGHVRNGLDASGREVPGAFTALQAAHEQGQDLVGTELLIQMSSDEMAVAKVTSAKVWTEEDLADYEKSTPVFENDDPKEPAKLQLITCVNTGTQTNANFSERLVVTAEFYGTLKKADAATMIKLLETLEKPVR